MLTCVLYSSFLRFILPKISAVIHLLYQSGRWVRLRLSSWWEVRGEMVIIAICPCWWWGGCHPSWPRWWQAQGRTVRAGLPSCSCQFRWVGHSLHSASASCPTVSQWGGALTFTSFSGLPTLLFQLGHFLLSSPINFYNLNDIQCWLSWVWPAILPTEKSNNWIFGNLITLWVPLKLPGGE